MSSVESSAFVVQLENITEALKECQNAKQGKESCSECESFFSCDLRRSYVRLVYIVDLENKTKVLKECQNAKQGKESCFGCESFFSCDLRHSYVKAAYDKMCEGEDKGFAF